MVGFLLERPKNYFGRTSSSFSAENEALSSKYNVPESFLRH
jgi:hypothetical protein